MVDVSEILYRQSVEMNSEERGEVDDDFEALENAHFSRFWSTVLEEQEEEYHYDYDYDLGMVIPPVFSRDFTVSNTDAGRRISSGSVSRTNFAEDEENQSLFLDLHCHLSRPTRDRVEAMEPLEFRVFDGIDEVGQDYFDVGIGGGLEIPLDVDRRTGEDDRDFGVVESLVEGLERWDGDDFRLSRRRIEAAGYVGDDEGIGIVGYDSESDFEDEQMTRLGAGSDGVQVSNWTGWDFDLPYSLESLRIEEDRMEQVADFEWEEIAEGANEGSVLRVVPNPIEEAFDSQGDEHVGTELEDALEEYASNLDWEGLFVLNNLNESQSIGHDDHSFETDDDDHFLSPLDYEVMFGRFADHDSPIHGNPPAAKSVVKNLPSIVVTEENAAKSCSICSVCKDEITIGATAKQLPCTHYYHGECILPWLQIRNTCPVCRYELPTDDPDHENQKLRDSSGLIHREFPV